MATPTMPIIEGEDRTLVMQKLFVAQASALRAWLLGLVPQPALADDIIQETFVTAMKKFDDFQPGTNFRAWIFAIARYKLLEACRHHAMQAVTLEPAAMEALIGQQTELPDHPDLRIRSLENCLKKLPQRAREVIELRYFNNLRPPAIATRMTLTLNSVNVSLSRARLALRDCVETSAKQTSPLVSNPS
jgi:RNA polymerase sigma-70 factor, ECF subfamily